MQIMIELGPEYRAAVSGLDETARRLRTATSAGLAESVGAIEAAGQAQYLSGQYFKVRTGNLRRAFAGWMASDLDAVVGVRGASAVDRYKWLLGDSPANQPLVIRPKKAKFLAIPIGENLTASGVARFNSPRDVEGGFFFRSKGQLLFGYRKGKTKRARVRVLFVMKKEVEVHDTGALVDAVLENEDRIGETINRHIEGIM